ncbi:hypothetical protein Gogos_018884, partial [Gossypium gossypioides]|nr:hypothetical protein [Gossypium gossypioides]
HGIELYGKNKNVPFVFAVEAFACVQSTQLGLNLGFMEVEIEGDALSVAKKLQREGIDKSDICAYIRDGQGLNERFCTCQFKHIHRSTNGVAHLLATEGLKKGE